MHRATGPKTLCRPTVNPAASPGWRLRDFEPVNHSGDAVHRKRQRRLAGNRSAAARVSRVYRPRAGTPPAEGGAQRRNQTAMIGTITTSTTAVASIMM